MSFNTEAIKNVTIVGHVATGKTSLVEQILYYGGIISRSESVESGKTVSDYTEEEINRQISIHTVLSHIIWKENKLNIVDTPGSSDFSGEVVSALRATESAVVLIDATSGVQIETIKIWRRLNDRNMPRAIFINKMDKERASFSGALEDLREKFGVTFVPITFPLDEGPGYKGIVNVFEEKAYMIPEKDKKETATDVPAEVSDTLKEYKMGLIESAAEGEDTLMENYFEEETLSSEEISRGLTSGFKSNKVVPVFCGSALEKSGINSMLEFLTASAPSPSGKEETAVENEEEKPVTISPEGGFSGFVFKTTIDQFSGKMSFIKVITGSLKPDSDVFIPREQKKERISKIYSAQGKKLDDTGELSAGDIAIVTKLGDITTNDSLCMPDAVVQYRPLQLPTPSYSLAVSAAAKKDEDKLNQALLRVADQDLTFKVEYDQETKETVIHGMGELQINMILDRIKESQKIEIDTKVPKVAYRETITKPAEAEYTHKKQTGGHGQFGRVVININPLERGEYYQFDNVIKGGAVSKGYIPGIEKGLHEAMESGNLAGYPIVDIGIKLVDGKEHPVDSSEMSFKQAAKGALKDAINKGNPVLLEPVMKLRVFVDDQYLGDILSDLSSRRGRVLGQEPIGGGIQEVTALVPQAELLRYSIDLRSLTSGTGSFEMEFDHYEPISGKIADAVIAASKAEAENE